MSPARELLLRGAARVAHGVGRTLLWAVMTRLRPLLVALQIPRTPALITGGLVVGAVVTGLVPRLLALAGLMRQTAAPALPADRRVQT